MAVPYKANNIDLKKCLLINFKKNYRDIKSLVNEINIYHDLMANGIECELVITDSVGLIEMFPIVGDETIIIQFVTPSFEEIREYVFRVYKVSNRTKGGQRTDSYILHGISQEVINSDLKAVNKSYRDMTGSQIVKAIHKDYMRPVIEDHYFVKTKKLYIQDTEQQHHQIFSNIKPIRAINTIAFETKVKNAGNIKTYNYSDEYKKVIKTEAVNNESQASNFIYYENYDGWYFRTIDSLLTQKYKNAPSIKPPAIEANYFDDFYLMDAALEQQAKATGIVVHPRQIISSIDFEKQFDTLENIGTGLYFHKVETIDPILKKFTTDNFHYDTEAKKFEHLEKNKKLYSKDSIFSKSGSTSYQHYFVSNIGSESSPDYYNIPYVNEKIKIPYKNTKETETDAQIRNPRQVHKWFSYDLISRTQLNNIVLTITIPGNTDIEIGHKVNLHIPQTSEVPEYMSKLNLLYNKRFFVIAVRHVINKNDETFFTTIECIKDVYGREIKEETN